MNTTELNENFDFTKICRLCLNENDLISIFEISCFKIPFPIIITECTGVLIIENDQLPKRICLECVECLNKYYEFRKLVAISERRLHNFLNIFRQNLNKDVMIEDTNNIKEEIDSNEELICPIKSEDDPHTFEENLQIENELEIGINQTLTDSTFNQQIFLQKKDLNSYGKCYKIDEHNCVSSSGLTTHKEANIRSFQDSPSSSECITEKLFESEENSEVDEDHPPRKKSNNCNNETKKIQNYFVIKQDPKSSKRTDKEGTCTLCTNKITILKMKNCATTSLKRHLESKHTKIYETIFKESESYSSTSRNCPTLNWLCDATEKKKNNTSEFQHDHFQKLLAEFVFKKYLPFNFFEDALSARLYKYLNPNITLPDRNQVSYLVTKKFNATLNTVRTFLKDYSGIKISFTIDGWHSSSMKGYYGITAQFIDSNWNLHSIFLDFVPTHGSTEAKLFFDVLKLYALTNSMVQSITTDNTNSNLTFINELKNYFICDISSENNHFVCFAHILNLSVTDFLRILDSKFDGVKIRPTDSDDDVNQINNHSNLPVKKILNLIQKLEMSDHLRSEFQEVCNTNFSLKMIIPKLDTNITRWQSIFDMLQWSLNFKQPLNILCEKIVDDIKITDTEWALIECVCQYLKSFKTLSTILESDEYCTLPIVIIGINMLLDKLEKWAHELDNKSEKDEMNVKLLLSIQASRDKIIKHYKKSNWMYCIVLILDPRHKVETFSCTTWGKELQQKAIKYFEDVFKSKYFRQTNNSAPSSSKMNKRNEICSEFDIDTLSLFKKSNPSQSSDSLWRYEIDKYLANPRADSSVNILKWWKQHENIFPNLAIMARDFLAIPATCTTIERQFSRTVLNVTKIRNYLSDDSIRSLMCLNTWLSNNAIKDKF